MKTKHKIVIGSVVAGLTILILMAKRNFMGPMWDPVTEKNIKTLHPAIQDRVRQFINEAYALGIKLRIYSAHRTHDEQARLFAQGRTTPGNIVTQVGPGGSWHNYRLAFDLVEIKDGKALWTNPRWEKIGELGKKHGFEWGGDWRSFVDKPHFQDNFGLSIAQAKELYRTGDDYINVA